MPDDFLFDVFLCHSNKDKAIVRPLAERLRADGVEDPVQRQHPGEDRGRTAAPALSGALHAGECVRLGLSGANYSAFKIAKQNPSLNIRR